MTFLSVMQHFLRISDKKVDHTKNNNKLCILMCFFKANKMSNTCHLFALFIFIEGIMFLPSKI